MMQTVLPRSWKEEFALAAAMRREDILFREKLERFEERRQQRRDDERERAEQQASETFDTIKTVLAAREAVVEFRVQLDGYDIVAYRVTDTQIEILLSSTGPGNGRTTYERSFVFLSILHPRRGQGPDRGRSHCRAGGLRLHH